MLRVALATFMEVLDTSIANVLLPHIAGSLSASHEESAWILTSYLVSSAIVLPISLWLSTIIGSKRFYTICVALFMFSSLLCGLAPSLVMPVCFRIMRAVPGIAPARPPVLGYTVGANRIFILRAARCGAGESRGNGSVVVPLYSHRTDHARLLRPDGRCRADLRVFYPAR